MANIRTVDDYIEYYSEHLCCEDSNCPTTRREAEYRFSDFQAEQIKYMRMSDGRWRWLELCDTGGYWEIITDLAGHLKHYFGKYQSDEFRCVCEDTQFLTMEKITHIDSINDKRAVTYADSECIVCCCLPTEEEE